MPTKLGNLTSGRAPEAARATLATHADFPLVGSHAAVSLWLLLALALVLLPASQWGGATYHADVVGGLAGPWLLVAMAMLLSVRAGGLNLSVWGCASLGSAVAWLAISRGAPAWLALVLAVFSGAAAGLIQGAIVWRFRVPSALTTGLGGLAIMEISRHLVAGPLERLGAGALGGFARAEAKLLLVAGLYGLTMLVLVAGHGKGPARRRWNLSSGAQMFAALIAGGALAAGGGAVVLASHSAYVSSAFILGDLRAPVAVALCGGWVWRERGGALLAGMVLPVAMMVATIWLEWVRPLGFLTGQLSMAALLAMVLAMQAVSGGGRWGWWRRSAIALAWLGVLITAVSAVWPIGRFGKQVGWFGGCLWAAGLILALARLGQRKVSARRKHRESRPPNGDALA